MKYTQKIKKLNKLIKIVVKKKHLGIEVFPPVQKITVEKTKAALKKMRPETVLLFPTT